MKMTLNHDHLKGTSFSEETTCLFKQGKARDKNMITPELAEKIVTEVRKYLNEDIIVVNTNGIIIASTDLKRVGNFHEGAKIAGKSKRKFIITKESVQQLQGVKPGINLPIFFQQEVIAVIGITGNPDQVSPFGEIIRKMTELLISESHFAEQSDWHYRALEGFLFDWLQENNWDETFLERAKFLTINLEVPRQMMIAKFDAQHEFVGRVAWAHLNSWVQKGEQDIIFRWGNDRIVLLLDVSGEPSASTVRAKFQHFYEFLNHVFGLPISAGVGKVVEPTKISITYRQAERALRAAKDTSTPVFDEDLTLEMILDDLSEETKQEFLSKTIAPLFAETELMETLRELFAQNHSLKKTAASLHIHINTLHYRLKKITEITGLNTANIEDLFILYIALKIANN